ncbi:MAG: hypothetical protein ACK45Y_10885, partial [Betaproteobacteria bacterium]
RQNRKDQPCVTIPKKRLQSSIFRFKQFVAEAPGAAMSEAIPLARLQSSSEGEHFMGARSRMGV